MSDPRMLLTHSCEAMKRFASVDPVDIDTDALVVYTSRTDEYGLPVRDGGSSRVAIQYCPWCGERLPESRSDEWFDRLQERGWEPEDVKPDSDLATSAWWRRGDED